MEKVTKLVDKTEDSTHWSNIDALEDAIKEHSEGGKLEANKKLIIISLNQDDGQYNVKYIQAGFKSSEIVSLLETAKQLFLRSMGY